MKSIILFLLFVFISLNTYSQPCPAPVGEPNQSFCSQTAWALISETNDTLANLKVCGENLIWYSDSSGINVLPETTVLAPGVTYYVSQTINGCESPLLAITVTDSDCGCVKNPGFQSTHGTSSLDGYTFIQQIFTADPNPDWSCNIDTNGGNGLPPATPYTPGPDNSTSAEAVLVTTGLDPTLLPYSHALPRTSPFSTCNSQAVRLNRLTTYQDVGTGKITSMRKEFIAGEVFSFDYAIVANGNNHPMYNLPFFQIKIFDENDILIQSQCIIAYREDCFFIEASTVPSIIYREWSCFQFDTSVISGQAATVEFSVTDCSMTGHFAYTYIDNIYAGEAVSSSCINPMNGTATLTSVIAPNSVEYEDCSHIDQPSSQGCIATSLPYNIQFPIEICGSYTMPGGASPSTVNTDVYKEGTNVGSGSIISVGANNFCVSVSASEITVPLYGNFSVKNELEFQLYCSAAYNIYLETPLVYFKVCPVAVCPLPLVVCSTQPGNGIGIFDLSQSIPEITANMNINDMIVSFYETIADAEADVNAITNPHSYQNIIPENQTLYARMDVDWANLAVTPEEGCFDIVEMELIVEDIPLVPDSSNLDPITVPDPNNTGMGVFDLTVQTPHIIGALTNVEVAFYEGQADAANEQNAIIDPANYTGTNEQVIYVNVKNVVTGCFNTTSFELLLDTTLSLEDPKQITLKLYPNPAEDMLYLQSNQFGSDVVVQVFGMQGNLLYSKTKLTSEQRVNLNVSQWASGVYFVKVTSDNTITLRKFVKK